MKNTYIKTTILIAALLCVNSLSSQIIRSGMVKNYDLRTIPIEFVVPDLMALPGQESILDLVKRYWDFNDNTKYVNIYKYTKLELRKSKIAAARFESNGPSSDVGSYGVSGNRFIISIRDREIATVQVSVGSNRAKIAYSIKMLKFMLENHHKFQQKWIGDEASSLYSDQLKNKTLLITNSDLKEISLEEIKKVYPYKIEVKSQAFIDKMILEDDPRYLAIHQTSYGGITAVNIIFATDDSTFVAWSKKKLKRFLVVDPDREFRSLIKKDFENFLKFVN